MRQTPFAARFCPVVFGAVETMHRSGKEDLGEDLFMFSSDYPHADRTEGTAGYLKNRNDISKNVRQKLLADNAQRFYGI